MVSTPIDAQRSDVAFFLVQCREPTRMLSRLPVAALLLQHDVAKADATGRFEDAQVHPGWRLRHADVSTVLGWLVWLTLYR